jgi:DNA-binding PadR family transcriptional regulator
MAGFNLAGFDKISLEEMSGIRLMSRIDSKYVVGLRDLYEILNRLEKDYFIQEIAGKRIFDYATLYYDTPGYEMYLAHQNGKLNRLKIRTREYTESHLCFLEIKMKSNKGVTEKIRIKHDRPDRIAGEGCHSFLRGNSPYTTSALEPKLWSYYRRITLVNKQKTERLTMDLDLRFQNDITQQIVELPRIAIVEIKKGGDSPSPALDLLSKMKMKASSVSKYCVGVALTEPEVKKNKLKSKLLMLNKITPIVYESIG